MLRNASEQPGVRGLAPEIKFIPLFLRDSDEKPPRRDNAAFSDKTTREKNNVVLFFSRHPAQPNLG